MSTIREQIITAIESKLEEILVSKGYAVNCGNKVFRGIKPTDPDDLPAISFFPGVETIAKEYRKASLSMPVRVEGIANFGDENASVVSEKILGDLIEAMSGRKWVVPFTSGGTYRVKAGDTIEGASSGATGYVESVSVSSGTWPGGTAAGNITIRRKSGTFEAENLDVGSNSNVATTTGVFTYQSPIETTTNSLADDIQYTEGGLEDYPEGGDVTVGASALFVIIYETESGNPFAQ
jgi:hypothetical protein